jgi:hypothetical protein
VELTFVDPQGVPTTWITAEDVHIVGEDGAQATSMVLYPTTSGELVWERFGAQDETGAWSVNIDLAGRVASTTYHVNSLKLGDVEKVSVGTLLTRHPAPGFTIYYSDSVPTALVADLQNHLSNTALLLERRIGTEMTQIPDVYLTGNRELMKLVGTVTGINLGFEDGYYTNFGDRPGIFLRTDLFGTSVRRVLTHEYVHHIFVGLANDEPLPAWLTEGLSTFYEFDTELLGPRPDAVRLRQFTSTDLARTASQAGSLFSLADLESQADWNFRTDEDELALQYAESYMAVRFLIETYGPLSGKDLVMEIGLGSDLADSIKTVTGLELADFESQFGGWLKAWENPERAVLARYLADLEALLEGRDAILEQRARDIDKPMTANEAIASRNRLVMSMAKLNRNLQTLTPPGEASDLHQEAEGYFSRIQDWLTLELLSAESQNNAPLAAANATIPEIHARDITFQQNMSRLQFVFNLA